MTAREALELATVGGAQVLGRPDIGHLDPGMAADFIAIDLDQPELSGTHRDPCTALIFCQVNRVSSSFIQSRNVVKAGNLTPLDVSNRVQQHQHYAQLCSTTLGQDIG